MPGTTEPNNFLYTPRPDLTGIGVLLFAATWLLVIGLLNLFYAISVIAGSEIFITTAGWLVGDARPWGWLMLIIALVQLVAAGGIFAGRRWALWIAVLSVFGTHRCRNHVSLGLDPVGDLAARPRRHGAGQPGDPDGGARDELIASAPGQPKAGRKLGIL